MYFEIVIFWIITFIALYLFANKLEKTSKERSARDVYTECEEYTMNDKEDK